MPQGDDFTESTPAPAPVDPTPPAAPAPDASDDAASAPADPTPEPTPTPDETPDAAQRRRDAAFAAQRRENAALKARLAAVEARLTPAPAATPEPAAPAARDQAPQPEAFATHAEYVQAVATWAVQQHETTKAAKATADTIQTVWEQQEAQTKTKYPDYDEALAADTTRYHPAVLEAIQTSEQGAEVAYHLATHPADAARISALAPAAALHALGKLEARLESATPPPVPAPTPTPTPKPRPLTPVGGAGTGGSTVSPDAMDYDAYTAWYTRTYGSR
jgi:hypothetical protein